MPFEQQSMVYANFAKAEIKLVAIMKSLAR
jgi:hypothetical protein